MTTSDAELTAEQVNAIEQAADRLRATHAEAMQSGAPVKTGPPRDWLDAKDALVDAYVAAGVERQHAGYAATVLLFRPAAGVGEALDEATGLTWHDPDRTYGLGLRRLPGQED